MRWLLPLVLLAACSRALDTPVQQVSCETLTDEASCLAAGCGVGSTCGCPYYGSGFAGCYAKAATGFGCPEGCGEAACEGLTDPVECTNRPDCYALLTYDEPCNNESCPSHFSSCTTGPPSCDQMGCPNSGGNGSCDGDNTYAYAAGGCAIGCVATAKCPTS
jgi:hypothetical protein